MRVSAFVSASVVFAVFLLAAAPAKARLSVAFINNTDQELVDTLMVTEREGNGERRDVRTRTCIMPGERYRSGVSAPIIATRMLLDLASVSYYFPDLSAFKDYMENLPLYVAFDQETQRPYLELADGRDAPLRVEGELIRVVTDETGKYGLDFPEFFSARTMGDVKRLFAGGAGESNGRASPSGETFEAEAGLLRDQAHAEERCPRLAEEWTAVLENRRIQWTGGWRAAVPGEMSVCEFSQIPAGKAPGQGSYQPLPAPEGNSLLFPANWLGAVFPAYALAEEEGDEAPVVACGLKAEMSLDLAFQTFDHLTRELGLRPLRLHVKKRGQDLEDENLFFREAEASPGAAAAKARDFLQKVWGGEGVNAMDTMLLPPEAFARLLAGKGSSEGGDPIVLLRWTRGGMEVIYMRDGFDFARFMLEPDSSFN